MINATAASSDGSDGDLSPRMAKRFLIDQQTTSCQDFDGDEIRCFNVHVIFHWKTEFKRQCFANCRFKRRVSGWLLCILLALMLYRISEGLR